MEELSQRVKDRHYEKLAQREKAPILFDTASPICKSFSQGLQQCAYNHEKWPTVWYETQNQHCTALLNIVATRLETMQLVDVTVSPSTPTTEVVTQMVTNDKAALVTSWYDFGLGYGLGMAGFVLLLFIRWMCKRLYKCLCSRSTGTVTQMPPRPPFAFVRGAPARLPAISIPDVRADIAISYTETVNPNIGPAEV